MTLPPADSIRRTASSIDSTNKSTSGSARSVWITSSVSESGTEAPLCLGAPNQLVAEHRHVEPETRLDGGNSQLQTVDFAKERLGHQVGIGVCVPAYSFGASADQNAISPI